MTDAENPSPTTFSHHADASTSHPGATHRVATKQTHPVRGVLWGIVFGLGLTIVAIVTKVVQLSLVPALLVLVIGVALGALWSMFGPPKPAPS